MLDVKRLRILREVVNQGSFSGAADALYLSQSAVSQQIATLEREVGMTLLERTRDGTKPTDAGRVLVEHADAAICRLDEAERELATIAGLEGGEIRIASFPSASATLLTLGGLGLHAEAPEGEALGHGRRARGSRCRASAPASSTSPSRSTIRPSRTPDERDIEHTLLLTESMHVALPLDHPTRGSRSASR